MCRRSDPLEKTIGTDDPDRSEERIKVYREKDYDKIWKNEIEWCYELARFLYDSQSGNVYIWAGYAEHKMVETWEGIMSDMYGYIDFTAKPSDYIAILFGQDNSRFSQAIIKSIEKSTGYKVVAYV